MKRIVCIALLLFVVFCVVARGQVYTLPRQPAHEIATKALGEALACGDLTRAEKHAREALLAWPDDQTAALVVKLVEERRAKESRKPNLVPKPAVPATTEQAGRPEVVIARAKPDPVEEVKPQAVARKALKDGRLDDARKAANEALKEWPGGPDALAVIAAADAVEKPAEAKPEQKGQAINVTVPAQPEVVPPWMQAIVAALVALGVPTAVVTWLQQNALKELKALHEKNADKIAGNTEKVASPVRHWTDEEFAAEARRRFPTKG